MKNSAHGRVDAVDEDMRYDMSNVVINMGMGEKLLVAESHFIQSLQGP